MKDWEEMTNQEFKELVKLLEESEELIERTEDYLNLLKWK